MILYLVGCVNLRYVIFGVCCEINASIAKTIALQCQKTEVCVLLETSTSDAIYVINHVDARP